MTEPLLAFALLGAIAATSIGAARIVPWLLDRRDRAAVQRVKEAVIVAQARAKLTASGWSAEDEAAFQAIRARLPFGASRVSAVDGIYGFCLGNKLLSALVFVLDQKSAQLIEADDLINQIGRNSISWKMFRGFVLMHIRACRNLPNNIPYSHAQCGKHVDSGGIASDRVNAFPVLRINVDGGRITSAEEFSAFYRKAIVKDVFAELREGVLKAVNSVIEPIERGKLLVQLCRVLRSHLISTERVSFLRVLPGAIPNHPRANGGCNCSYRSNYIRRISPSTKNSEQETSRQRADRKEKGSSSPYLDCGNRVHISLQFLHFGPPGADLNGGIFA